MFYLCRLKSNAVPTLFSVPNPPLQLTASRPPPKRRRLDVDAADIAVATDCSTQLQNVVNPVSDHTYSSVSETECSVSNLQCDTLALPECSVSNSQTSYIPTSSASGIHCHRTVKRKIWSAREKRLKKIICRQRVKICRLNKALASMKQKTTVKANAFEGAFGKRLCDFFSRQSRLSRCKNFGKRFSPSDKNFALSLYFTGPKAYSFCQQLFILPSKRTLQLWLSRLNIKPGFSESVLVLLEKKVHSMNEQNKLCALLLDEMSLKTALVYNAPDDIIEGYEDCAHLGRSTKIANSALVFMVKGLCGKWKQPIGYFLSSNATSAEKLKALVTSAVEKLVNIGLIVRVVICDQGSTNQQMFRLFNVCVDKPYVELSGLQVVFMFDPPHLLKNVRNNLCKHDFVIDGKTVSWKYVKQFFESDSSLKIRMAPKLTKKHIELPPFAAMRVCLAAQVFSHTVAAGILTYVALGKMPDEATATAEFVKLIDSLFDCFNSRNLYDKKALRRPLTAKSASSHWPFLEECSQQLKTLQVVGGRGAIPCLSGWLLCINALKLLWSVANGEHGVSFLLTSRLNQDALENFFSLIRSRGGHRDNPDSVHFKTAFKQMAVQSIFVPPPSANCQGDFGQFLLGVDDFSVLPVHKKVNFTDESVTDVSSGISLLCSLSPELNSVENSLHDDAQQNTLMYITGYVCKRILDRHNCKICRSVMLRDNTALMSECDLFCSFKAYNQLRGNFGGLKAPSDFMFDVMKLCECIFNSMFDSVKHSCGVKSQLVAAVFGQLSSDTGLQPCIASLKRAVNIFMSTRIHYALKFFNKDKKFVKDSKARKNRKALKVMHN
jgi:hypothetical protein